MGISKPALLLLLVVTLAGSSCGGGGGGHHAGIDVAILYQGDYGSDVQAKLSASPDLGSVTYIDLGAGTPTVTDLLAFRAVLVSTDGGGGPGFDPVALGDVLADYVDAGGGVVCAMFCYDPGLAPAGRWAADDYLIIPPVSAVDVGTEVVGTFDGAHPIMSGFGFFAGGSSSFRPNPSATIPPSGTLVASWEDGAPLVATRVIGLARRVDLGFYPPSGDIRSDFWNVPTDGVLLMVNSLRWAAGDL
jgi:hypothetical protein